MEFLLATTMPDKHLHELEYSPRASRVSRGQVHVMLVVTWACHPGSGDIRPTSALIRLTAGRPLITRGQAPAAASAARTGPFSPRQGAGPEMPVLLSCVASLRKTE